MLCIPPFRVWPLHVKLFTDEAVEIWSQLDQEAGIESISPCEFVNLTVKQRAKGKKKANTDPESNSKLSFPRGFTCEVELEGLDGQSDHPFGSGRTWPLGDQDRTLPGSVCAGKLLITLVHSRTFHFKDSSQEYKRNWQRH